MDGTRRDLRRRGCNYKSHQPGRALRYNLTYCNDKRYASFHNLLHTGDLYSEQFCYHDIPEKLDPFDAETFAASPMEFFVVCTELRTGDPVYHKCRTGGPEDLKWMQASASMPLASRTVQVGPHKLLDGGIADSIPVRFLESIGYRRNVIVLTQPKGYEKKKNKLLPAIRARYARYPAFVAAVADRHERYNETLAYIAMLEEAGEAYVVRPPIALEIGAMERDPRELQRVYDTGRAVAEKHLSELERFLASAVAGQFAQQHDHQDDGRDDQEDAHHTDQHDRQGLGQRSDVHIQALSIAFSWFRRPSGSAAGRRR